MSKTKGDFMARQLTQWLGTIAVSGLVALGLPTVAPAPARATAGITQPGPFEAGNLLDYANSDFEGAIGNWTSVSNATLTDDTTHAFLYNDSLRDTVPAAGTSTFKLGNAPENDTFSGCPGSASGNGPNFVCYFEQQSGNIRQAANDAPNVFVAMDAETYQYGSVSSHDDGTSCSFIPPATYTDFYLADHYDESLNGVNINGESLPNEIGQNGTEWSNWLSCVQGINKPIGLAEYGQDCTTNPDQAVVTQAITADGGYLQAIPKATEPTIMWEYWYSDSGFTTGPGCEFDNSAGGITEWQSLETRNGGG